MPGAKQACSGELNEWIGGGIPLEGGIPVEGIDPS